jgi:hypothetical protein
MSTTLRHSHVIRIKLCEILIHLRLNTKSTCRPPLEEANDERTLPSSPFWRTKCLLFDGLGSKWDYQPNLLKS